jgi:hypothetical protein
MAVRDRTPNLLIKTKYSGSEQNIKENQNSPDYE